MALYSFCRIDLSFLFFAVIILIQTGRKYFVPITLAKRRRTSKFASHRASTATAFADFCIVICQALRFLTAVVSLEELLNVEVEDES